VEPEADLPLQYSGHAYRIETMAPHMYLSSEKKTIRLCYTAAYIINCLKRTSAINENYG